MSMANVVFTRYYEQLDTTFETMRRRMVAYYDIVMKIGEKSRVLAERARELSEVSYFDVKDQVTNAIVQENMEDIWADRDTRNTIVELYLGCAVSTLAISVGLLCGAYTFPFLLSLIFHPLVEFLLFSVLPVYASLKLRKYGDGDGSERRLTVFTMSLVMSTLLGHFLDTKATNLIPAMMFIAPTVFALGIDVDFLRTYCAAGGRHAFLGLNCALAGVATLFIAHITGSIGIFFSVFVISHLAWLMLHFQLSTAAIKSKTFQQGDYEIMYVVGLILSYALFAFCTSGAQDEAVLQ